MFGKLKYSLTAGMVALGVAAGGAASAATVEFDFREIVDEPNAATVVMERRGVTATITSTGGSVTTGTEGLGVSGNPNGGRWGVGETLTITFSKNAILDMATVFELGGGSNDVEVEDGSGNLLLSFDATDGANTDSFFQATPGGLIEGTVFVFSLTNSDGSASQRGIRLTELDVSIIPLPAGGLLLLAGLGGLAIVRHRRSA